MRRLLFAGVLLLAQVGFSLDGGAPPVVRTKVWNVPRVLDVVDAPGVTWVHGVPVTMHALRSAEKLEALVLDLRQQFIRANLFLPPHKGSLMPGAVQLSGIDPDTFIVYTAFAQANPDGTSTVILTETAMAARRSVGPPRFAPVMPAAVDVFTTETEGLQVLQYGVTGTQQDVTSFYAETLTRAKYVEASPGVFRRGSDELRISTRPGKSARDVSVVVQHRQSILPSDADTAR